MKDEVPLPLREVLTRVKVRKMLRDLLEFILCLGCKLKLFLTFTYVKLFNLSSMHSNGSVSFTLLTTFLISPLTDAQENRYS